MAEKHIKEYRFDEASRVIYKFVWNSYCDWYLELSKTIIFSNNRKNINEVKNTLSFVFKETIILLHPFIPFITEELWLKNKLGNQKEKYLMYASWIKDNKVLKDKEISKVQSITFVFFAKNFLNFLNCEFVKIGLSKT